MNSPYRSPSRIQRLLKPVMNLSTTKVLKQRSDRDDAKSISSAATANTLMKGKVGYKRKNETSNGKKYFVTSLTFCILETLELESRECTQNDSQDQRTKSYLFGEAMSFADD